MKKNIKINFYYFFLVILCLFFYSDPIFAITEVNIGEKINSDINFSNDLVHLFLSKTEIFKKDSVDLFIITHSPYNITNEPEIILSNNLSITQVSSDSLTLLHLRKYKVNGEKIGNYHIFVNVKLLNSSTGSSKNISVNKILKLKILNKSIFSIGTIGSIIIGAILGLLSSFLTSIFNEWRQEKEKLKIKKQWVFNTLIPRLLAAKSDIENQRPVSYETWISEYYEKGYYSIIQELSKSKAADVDLCSELIEIHSLFKRYDQEQKGITLDNELVKTLIKKITIVIANLSKRNLYLN